ncbi:6-phospho-3-hexuloisomerase [Caldilinea sp.]|jgi:6-phospho-3-hexuloisomerase|uniref:6-phospho-3-hexuloisomerase n=1 Tax=Caldilinea sp. TaxID=2293560 RepID=UPI0021DD2FDE|nr:6-phospho-3-hexuloisomerase [Caldilinea sp.]GIV67218.1 MAG: hexulose-6-phosphate isomerase [Caldilinea sp.]
MSGADFHAMAAQAIREVGAVLAALSSDDAERMCDEILRARRIACYGVGREGLMMKALCMRLMHLGLDAHVVGDMTTPPIGPGDLLIVSAGPGAFSTVLALMGVAQESGSRTMVVTAQPQGKAAQQADVVIHLPAQTMANDQTAPSSILPMGSLYEAAQLIFFDLISILLREKTGQTPEEMRSRHTNLE